MTWGSWCHDKIPDLQLVVVASRVPTSASQPASEFEAIELIKAIRAIKYALVESIEVVETAVS